MSGSPSVPVSSEQAKAFRLAVCERLGIDPAIVSASDFHWEVRGDDELARVSLTAFLPADELIAAFNEAARALIHAPDPDAPPSPAALAAAVLRENLPDIPVYDAPDVVYGFEPSPVEARPALREGDRFEIRDTAGKVVRRGMVGPRIPCDDDEREMRFAVTWEPT